MCSAEEGPAGELIQVIAEDHMCPEARRTRVATGPDLDTSCSRPLPLRTPRCRSVSFAVIQQQHVSVSMAMSPGRCCFHRGPASMAAGNLEAAARSSSQEKYKPIQHNLTHGATKTHQKEHLGLFLPPRTENRPLSNLDTRWGLCCQSRNPQIILVQNGLLSKTGSS